MSEDPFFCDFGEGKGGKCTDCFSTKDWEPCCGSPCNFGDGAYCFVCWSFGFLCTMPKFHAWTVGREDCDVLHDCGPWLLMVIPLVNIVAMFVLLTAERVNHRKIHGLGEAKVTVHDVLIGVFCSPCVLCQHLRSRTKAEWDWLPIVQDKGVKFSHEDGRDFLVFKP